jgi:hypothetical protein
MPLIGRPFRPLLVFAAFVAAPRVASAQDAPGFRPAPQWEIRLDATAAKASAAHAGLGMNVRAGPYARVGFGLAGGAALGPGDAWRASQRADVTARFLLDPFGERRLGWYGGAGVSARRDGDEPVVGRLVVLIGVEGRPTRALVPSVEVALGGGARLGVVLRRRRAGSR